jgi:hypothetical protein
MQQCRIAKTEKSQEIIQNSKLQHSISEVDELRLSQALRVVSIIVYNNIFDLVQQFQQFVLELLRQLPQLRAIFMLYQQGILVGPSLFLKDDIHFWDAQGRFHRLNFTYFRHFAVFEAFLVSQFKTLPTAAQKVRNGDYHLIDLSEHRHTIEEASVLWEERIKPRSKFAMTMLVRAGYRRLNEDCPRSQCNGIRSKSHSNQFNQFNTCSLCGLEYESTSPLPRQEETRDLSISLSAVATSPLIETTSMKRPKLLHQLSEGPDRRRIHPLHILSPASETQLLGQLKRVRVLPNDQLPTHFKVLGERYGVKCDVDAVYGITTFPRQRFLGSNQKFPPVHWLISDHLQFRLRFRTM